jgi:hypothetical protein
MINFLIYQFSLALNQIKNSSNVIRSLWIRIGFEKAVHLPSIGVQQSVIYSLMIGEIPGLILLKLKVVHTRPGMTNGKVSMEMK